MNPPISELMADYDAVLVAAGAHAPLRLSIAGEDAEGVVHGLPFMYEVDAGGAGEGRCILAQIEGKRVLVVGGGHTAIDCARSSVRLGAKAVEMVCLESKEAMPADPHEVAEAETEGILSTFWRPRCSSWPSDSARLWVHCSVTEGWRRLAGAP